MKTAGKSDKPSAKLIFLLPIFFMAWHCSSSSGSDSSGPATPVPTYTITYDGNGSTGGTTPTDTNAYAQGSSVAVVGKGSLVKSGTPTPVFVGWNTQANGSGTTYAAGTILSMGSANITLYARWSTATTYTITYSSSSGGTLPTDSNKYLNGDTVTVLSGATLVKAGFTFDGWNTSSIGTGTNYAPGATFIIAGNQTLYAKWSALPTLTLTFNGNGNTGGAPPAAANSYAGGLVVVLNNTGNMTLAGFAFSGWNTAANGSGTDYAPASVYTMGAINATIYTKWLAINCQQTTANPVSNVNSLGGVCATPVLVDQANGTILDTANNLLWIRCTVSKDVGGTSIVRETAPNTGNCINVNVANVYFEVPGINPEASDLCSNLTYAGRSNWVLPDLRQLSLYYKATSSAPYVVDSGFSALIVYNDPNQIQYVTTTTGTSNKAGFVDFSRSEGSGGFKTLMANSTAGIVTCVVKL